MALRVHMLNSGLFLTGQNCQLALLKRGAAFQGTEFMELKLSHCAPALNRSCSRTLLCFYLDASTSTSIFLSTIHLMLSFKKYTTILRIRHMSCAGVLRPIVIRLGTDPVPGLCRGLRQGLQGMRIGGERSFLVPAGLLAPRLCSIKYVQRLAIACTTSAEGMGSMAGRQGRISPASRLTSCL